MLGLKGRDQGDVMYLKFCALQWYLWIGWS